MQQLMLSQTVTLKVFFEDSSSCCHNCLLKFYEHKVRVMCSRDHSLHAPYTNTQVAGCLDVYHRGLQGVTNKWNCMAGGPLLARTPPPSFHKGQMSAMRAMRALVTPMRTLPPSPVNSPSPPAASQMVTHSHRAHLVTIILCIVSQGTCACKGEF